MYTLVSSIILIGLLALTGCKSSQENMHASYEAAKEKPQTSVYVVEEVTPVEKAVVIEVEEPVAPKEKLTTISGPSVNTYSVVIGSFSNRTNATSLKERMESRGYSPTLAQNERNMYRVILATFEMKSDARTFRDRIKRDYAPEFSDIWILEQIK